MACRSILAEFPSVEGYGGATICWLPMAALFQRMMNYVALATGVAIYFVEDPATVVAVAREVQPAYFIGVPRFFEKLYQGIQRELATKPAWVRKRVARSLSGARDTRSPNSATWTRGVLDRMVLRRLRGVLGRRLRFVITGSAPTPSWMLEYFDRLGILLLEAYGLSENAVPIAANRPDTYRFGSVGQVFKANEVKLAEDGEILVRGPGVFAGYWAAGECSVPPLTADGFFRTGDLGRFDADRFLWIVGRKGEIFKTSNGRRIAPSKLEAAYKRIPYVDQVVVTGHGRPYPAALLTVNMPLLISAMRAAREGLRRRQAQTGEVSSREMTERIATDIEAIGSELAPYERIKRFELLAQPLTLEGGELTPSLKLRREVIERKYRDLIDKIYSTPT